MFYVISQPFFEDIDLSWWSTMHCAEPIASDTQSARFNKNWIDKLQSDIKTMNLDSFDAIDS